jgi:hypothetical protein
MQSAIKQYLESKKLAWAPSTLRSEKARLNAVSHLIEQGPEKLWEALEAKGTGRYSRVTLWTTITNFLVWAKSPAATVFKQFRMENKRLFKNAYTKKPARFTADQVRERIALIECEESRALATFLFESACRYTESQTYKDGWVTGKGNKPREVLNAAVKPIKYQRCYTTFWRHLAQVGLKPHDIRKTHLSQMAMQVNPFELAQIAGWSDVKTAQSYVTTEGKGIREAYKKCGGVTA